MLYSILPPIIVIISFIAVIVFLARKASKVASLRETRESEEGENKKTGIFKKTAAKFNVFSNSGFKIWLWSILEKLIGKFRMGFLKLETLVRGVGTKIREKKNGKREELKASEETKKFSDEAGEERYDFPSLKKEMPGSLLDKTEKIEEKLDFKEKPIRPIISDKVVSPRQRSEIKDILESVLIERIAANPKDVEAYERLGEYYMEIGNYEHAKECVRQIMKLNPANKSAKYKMKRLERLMNG